MAEAAVKILKGILKKNKDPFKAIPEYRTSPIANGFSPAELLMGRKIRGVLPFLPSQLEPRQVTRQEIAAKEDSRIKGEKRNYDKHHGARDKDLASGDVVWMKDKKSWATVQEKVAPRSFNVETSGGRTLRRNTFLPEQGFRGRIPEPEVELDFETEKKPFLVPLEPIVQNPGPRAAVNQPAEKVSRSGRVIKPPKKLIEEI